MADRMDLVKALEISAAGMQAQGVRIRVISENIANADSIATTPGGDPYQRKTVSFTDQLNRSLGIETVRVAHIGTDTSAFQLKYDPHNPAADSNGYVKMPNVNPLIEMVDMQEAQRSYEANLNVLQASRTMLAQTVSLLNN
ncbi:MAG TPA: flagellar basal body rod protein FlgC [Alphaproteobacteria bacterium]|nr:flagellar basal body rod protein FlgC [Alphaproteobacteria bacterium]